MGPYLHPEAILASSNLNRAQAQVWFSSSWVLLGHVLQGPYGWRHKQRGRLQRAEDWGQAYTSVGAVQGKTMKGLYEMWHTWTYNCVKLETNSSCCANNSWTLNFLLFQVPEKEENMENLVDCFRWSCIWIPEGERVSSGCRYRQADEEGRESWRREGGATARGDTPQIINQCQTP